MSEELLQRNLLKNPEKIGNWDFYNIGSTTVKALKEHGIIRSINYGDEERKKVDALIVQNKNVIAIIEYKKPSEFKTSAQKDKAIKQELEVARKLDASILIATDTKETIWINVLTGNAIKDENGQEIKINFDPQDTKICTVIEKIKFSINELNDQIKPKQLVNPTNLAKQIWQDIWSVSGATPENCLYTFVELFIFKYLSDLGVLQGIFNFDTLYKSFDGNTEDEVLETYASSIRPKIKSLFPENPLDKTTIINGTIFVSKDQNAVKGYSTVFKKVLTKFKDYGKLEHIDYDFKSQLFESFLKESISKKNWGQFFTPLKVVRAVVKLAKDDIKEGSKICDPACGVGKFLLEPIITRLDQFYEIKAGKLIPKITICGYDKGFDKDEQKTIILAKANMLIYFSDFIKENPTITTEFSKLFNDSFILKTNSILGTLSEPVENEYDLILTNPPYVTSGSSNLKEEIKKDGSLTNYYKVNAIGVEGLFLEWIIRALKPNGKAFIIVPDGIFNRQNDKNLRQFIIDECNIDGIISLPIKTFFNTPKKTYLLCITKKISKNIIQTDPVFTYLVSEIGETRDVYRFDIEQDDLSEAITLYSFFKGNKSAFQKINTDKRCKIQNFDKFNPEIHWSVDRWWSQEEQIELGIIEENETVSFRNLSEMISDFSSTLNEYANLFDSVSEKEVIKSEFKEVSLSNTTYFDLKLGKRILKKDLIKIQNGTIPIYSANVKDPIGFHTESNIDNFDNNFVLWGIDGNFGFNSIPKNTPFVSTDHCGTIRILNEFILPEYLMIQLENVKHKYGFDRGLRASINNMKDIVIKLPFHEDGIPNIEKQKEVVKKYEYIKDLKDKIATYKEQLFGINIDFQ
ncbi:MAG: N-6 DNA methylase [Nostocales cyanobacterium LE14-WE4]|jgi:type I restriction enzyme M protein|nr:N-6 DNA methylase [Anabaena sp. 49633_E8]MCE2699931.1 N-6 DNA methylase [Anabaena sp. 49633_E8]MDJ0501380.1 N-6 DNA methylase [Nostocales cyanobacterium LE14-WE4]